MNLSRMILVSSHRSCIALLCSRKNSHTHTCICKLTWSSYRRCCSGIQLRRGRHSPGSKSFSPGLPSRQSRWPSPHSGVASQGPPNSVWRNHFGLLSPTILYSQIQYHSFLRNPECLFCLWLHLCDLCEEYLGPMGDNFCLPHHTLVWRISLFHKCLVTNSEFYI